MLFALLTLLSALSLAATAGWFSIAGFMAIYAGAPMYALIMGVVTEVAKLVTTSWLYRNWQYSNWKLKIPLIYFTLALMTATSIGVYGFLSKAHLEQGAGTLDNSSKIESLQSQIDREKAIIADNEKIITQLDSTVNALLEKDRADKSLAVRKSQAPQRKQLRDDIAASQKKIDEISAEKFKLESEVRKLQLEVGPIRYIAELFYGADGNTNKNIEAAIRIFTLLLVSTLDPLAVILLIAANHSLLRIRNEEEKKTKRAAGGIENSAEPDAKEISCSPKQKGSNLPCSSIQITEEQNQKELHLVTNVGVQETAISAEVLPAPVQINEEETSTQKSLKMGKVTTQNQHSEEVESDNNSSSAGREEAKVLNKNKSDGTLDAKENIDMGRFLDNNRLSGIAFANSPRITPIQIEAEARHISNQPTVESSTQTTNMEIVSKVDNSHWAVLEKMSKELSNAIPHFVPRKINEEKNKETGPVTYQEAHDTGIESRDVQEIYPETPSADSTQGNMDSGNANIHAQPRDTRGKYSGIGWIQVFKGTKNE